MMNNYRNLFNELEIDRETYKKKKRGTVDGLFSEEVAMIQALINEGKGELIKKLLKAESREEYIETCQELNFDLETANAFGQIVVGGNRAARSLVIGAEESGFLYDAALDILKVANERKITLDDGINDGLLSKLLDQYAEANGFSDDEDTLDEIWMKILKMGSEILAN